MEPLPRALQENAANLSMESIAGEDIVRSLEKSEGHNFYYCGDNKENEWPGIKLLKKCKKESNIVCTRTIEEISSEADTSMTTETTVTSLDS